MGRDAKRNTEIERKRDIAVTREKWEENPCNWGYFGAHVLALGNLSF